MTLHGRTKRRGLLGAVSPIVIFFGRSVILVRRYVGHRRGQYLQLRDDVYPCRAARRGGNSNTVNRARESTGPHGPVEDDDRPTIDKPPKGELWDDQVEKQTDDQGEKRVGKDGKQRPDAQWTPRRAPGRPNWHAGGEISPAVAKDTDDSDREERAIA